MSCYVGIFKTEFQQTLKKRVISHTYALDRIVMMSFLRHTLGNEHSWVYVQCLPAPPCLGENLPNS